MDCIICQDLANDSGQTEDRGRGGGGGGIAFPELRPASGWTQLKKSQQKTKNYI